MELDWSVFFVDEQQVPDCLKLCSSMQAKPVKSGYPVEPIRYENGIPFFSKDQIDQFGLPDYFGVFDYMVVSERENEHPLATDFQFQKDREKLRAIHYYDRVERFVSILAQLIGSRGKVPLPIIEEIKKREFDKSPERVWNEIYCILKSINGRKYYNRIPIILKQLGYPLHTHCDQQELIQAVIRDFQHISFRFEQIKKEIGRCYFPSLRYIAFRLLQLHGVKFHYKIPIIRTARKVKLFESLWQQLLDDTMPEQE